MKRKALIILSIAILAFAMIPAIGAGAATAAVKIVTPHELANPTGDDDSAFDNLASAEYVSDVTGRQGMADTYGTLYAVIEDNDKDANQLTTYTAYFPAGDTSGAARTVLSLHTGTEAVSTDATIPNVHNTAHKRAIPTGTPVASEGFQVADSNGDGRVDGEDVDVWLCADSCEGGNRPQSLQQKFIIDAVNTLGDTAADHTAVVTLDLSTRGAVTQQIRVQFATAQEDKDTVDVRSGTDEITIDVIEKNLGSYAAEDNDAGIDSTKFAGAESVDSGTFVGSFGLIPKASKDMISDWATDAVGADKTILDASPAVNIDPVATPVVITDPEDSTTSNGPDIRALLVNVGTGNFIVDANGDRKIDHTDIDADFQALTGSTFAGGAADELVAITPTPGVSVTITSLSARGVTGAGDVVTCSVPVGSAQVGSEPTADPSPTQRVACVEIHVPDDGTTRTETTFVTGPATDPDDITTTPVGTAFDKVEFTFNTESNTKTLLDAVEEIDADDMHEAFEELGDGRADLTKALTEQARNLGIGIDADTRASGLVGRLLGVDDKGIVEVRYNDPSTKSIQRTSSIVDLALPTVDGFDPPKDNFTTEDSFTVLFSVSDNGAGIPEDAEDSDENTVGNTNTPLVAVTIAQPDGGNVAEDDLIPDVDQTKEDVTDGYQYETDVDVNRDSNNQENIEVTVTITAYDLAGNMAEVKVKYIIDTKDPVLEGALTGVGAKLNNKLARDTNTAPTLGAYEVIENDPTWIALVFDDAINGALLDPAEVVIAGETVESLVWLDGKGANVITTTGDAMNRETITEDNGAGLDLEASGFGQVAHKILFVKLAAELDTSARPAVEIDASDLEDLAGNQDRTDHTIARAHDRLAPKLTLTVVNPLSNSSLDVNIESSEELRRIPSASITKIGDNPTDKNLTVKRVGSGWAIEANAKSIGQTTGGVRTISVNAEDEDGNKVTKTAKWELDVEANGGDNPTRVGIDDSTKAHSIETNPVTFLSLRFDGEEDEYGVGNGVDSKKTVDITGVSLETLDAASVKANGTIAATADITVTGTVEVDDASVQSSNQVTHVVALTELALGNYRLQVNYTDAAGNTGKFAYVFRITAPAPAEITVVPGWSLVSIPGTPADLSIGGVLEGSAVTDVWSLNNETKVWEFARQDENGEWMGTLSQLVDGRAYFVRSTTFDPIKVLTERFSPQRTPSQYVVTNGWNGIGYTPAGSEEEISVDAYLSSLGASGWGMIRMWNTTATPPQYETYFSSGAATEGFPRTDNVAVVEEGKGYLLFATRSGVIGG